jgi:peptidoglycan/xylan/chitin deacetylase (PgdA/CDA1 family)
MPFPPASADKRPVILMYHGVPRAKDRHGFDAEAFAQQISFLADQFEIVPLAESGEGATNRTRVCLTFDDGFQNNAEVAAPILKQAGAPGTFFVSTRHLLPGRHLWFAYLEALDLLFREPGFQLDGRWWDMTPPRRANTVANLRRYLLSLRPHPSSMYRVIESQLPSLASFTTEEERRDQFNGMSADQLAELSRDPLFTLAGHTADHPMLTLCEPAEAARQIGRGKLELEHIMGKSCTMFAYPSEDFAEETVAQCRRCGFKAGFSVHREMDGVDRLVTPRTGVYHASTAELGFKIRWSSVLRRVQQWKTFPKL